MVRALLYDMIPSSHEGYRIKGFLIQTINLKGSCLKDVEEKSSSEESHCTATLDALTISESEEIETTKFKRSNLH